MIDGHEMGCDSLMSGPSRLECNCESGILGEVHRTETEAEAAAMREVLEDVAKDPYPDSNLKSLLESLQREAKQALSKKTGKKALAVLEAARSHIDSFYVDCSCHCDGECDICYTIKVFDGHYE